MINVILSFFLDASHYFSHVARTNNTIIILCTIFIFDAEKEGDIVLLIFLHASPLELKTSLGSLSSVRRFGKGYVGLTEQKLYKNYGYVGSNIALTQTG